MNTKLARLVFILASLLTAFSAQAFNKDRCGTLFPKSDDTHPPYYSPLYVSTMFPSTTSYFSSVGPCSMYAGNMARQAFIKDALGPLQIDVARGEGEYLNALAQLSGCPNDKYSDFASVLHGQFENVFGPTNNEPAAVLKRVDAAVLQTPSLKSSCSIPN